MDKVRSRPWVSATMGRMADHGQLIETAEQGRYEFPCGHRQGRLNNHRE